MLDQRSVLDNIGYVSLVNRHDDALISVVNAARTSYAKTKTVADDSDKKLTQFLWANAHTSPFRHQHYTFCIKAPLFVMRQWFKHQIGCPWTVITHNGEEVELDLAAIIVDTDTGTSWNEVSGRYVVLEPEFYIPDTYRSNTGHANKQVSSEDKTWDVSKHAEARRIVEETTHIAYEAYKTLIKQGVAREMARTILPQNIYTSAVWTPSLQALIHFLKLRCKPDAQYEIRAYADAIADIVRADFDKLGISI